MLRQTFRTVIATALSEIGATVALGVIALGGLAFALVAGEALEGDARAFDEAILLPCARRATPPIRLARPGWNMPCSISRRLAVMWS